MKVEKYILFYKDMQSSSLQQLKTEITFLVILVIWKLFSAVKINVCVWRDKQKLHCRFSSFNMQTQVTQIQQIS